MEYFRCVVATFTWIKRLNTSVPTEGNASELHSQQKRIADTLWAGKPSAERRTGELHGSAQFSLGVFTLPGPFCQVVVSLIPFRSLSMSYSPPRASHWARRPSTSLCCSKREADLKSDSNQLFLHQWLAVCDFTSFCHHAGQVSRTFNQWRHLPELLLSWRCRYMGRLHFLSFLSWISQ